MSAVYTRILNDVDSLIAVAAPGFNRVIQKEIALLEHQKALLPLVFIVPNMQATTEEGFEGALILDYTVGVAIVFAGNMTLEGGLAQVIDGRDAIRKALHVTSLPTASVSTDPCGVFDSSVDMNPPFDTKALAANYDYSLMEFTYRSSEARN